TTHLHTLSLHDALPIWNFLSGTSKTNALCSSATTANPDPPGGGLWQWLSIPRGPICGMRAPNRRAYHDLQRMDQLRNVACQSARSEEHTSELQSRENLV